MSGWAPPSWATPPARGTVTLDVRDRASNTVLRTHSLANKPAFTLGRQMGAVDIHVPDEVVSRVHAALVHKGDKLFVIDLKSAAGVAVDGFSIPPNEARELKEGSRFALGNSTLRYYVRGLAPAAAAPAPAEQQQQHLRQQQQAAMAPPASAAAPPPASAAAAAAATATAAAATAAAATAAPAQPAAGWQPPAWAVMPSATVKMHLEEGGKHVQSLDLSRHPSYVLGRSAATAKLVVPHESVSRQHAAIIHGLQGPAQSPSVHVVDLASAKGTFVDLGRGWTRLTPNTPVVLVPGTRVRLGDCPTRIVYPHVAAAGSNGGAAAPGLGASAVTAPLSAAPPPPPGPSATAGEADPSIGPSIGPVGPPGGGSRLRGMGATATDSQEQNKDEEDDGTPRFSSLLSSTIVPADPAANGGGDGGDAEGGAAGDVDGAEAKKSNSDFRNALLPFLSAPPVNKVAEAGKGGKKGKKRRKGGDDSESDGEPAPPLSLDKNEPSTGGPSGGLILRKTGGGANKGGPAKKAKSSPKIVF